MNRARARRYGWGRPSEPVRESTPPSDACPPIRTTALIAQEGHVPSTRHVAPHQAKSLRTGQVTRAAARALNIGFDDSRGDVAVMYLLEDGT